MTEIFEKDKRYTCLDFRGLGRVFIFEEVAKKRQEEEKQKQKHLWVQVGERKSCDVRVDRASKQVSKQQASGLTKKKAFQMLDAGALVQPFPSISASRIHQATLSKRKNGCFFIKEGG